MCKWLCFCMSVSEGINLKVKKDPEVFQWEFLKTSVAKLLLQILHLGVFVGLKIELKTSQITVAEGSTLCTMHCSVCVRERRESACSCV